jgi:hypothetical protein
MGPSMVLMTELLISEVMTAHADHEPVDIAAAIARCRARIPAHPETDDELVERLKALAEHYGAALFLAQK